jgi:hypothetical protein
VKQLSLPILVVLLAAVATLALAGINATRPVKAAGSSADFDSQGRLKLPTGYRRWNYLGVSVTPNGLNSGDAPFPEFHHVYVEERNLDAYLKSGSFPEGTVLCKELTRVLDPTFPDGSRKEPSGRGFFDGAYNGLDVMVKDNKRFAKTNGWGFFTFGHHAPPYAEWAAEGSVLECAGCHMTYVSKTDMTYVQFYPILHTK